jgi:hypothetical protein
MKKLLVIASVVAITWIIVMISCSRNDISPDQTDQFSLAENEAVFEAVLTKVDDQINREISMLEKSNFNILSVKSEIPACNAKITVESYANSKFPRTITLDYGSGCTDSEGNFRSGKIVVTITGPWWEEKSVRVSKLIDYVFNDLKIGGERKETNNGKNDKGYYEFEVENTEKISKVTGELLSEREVNRVRIYNRGKDLTLNTDDEVWLTGTVKVKRNDKEFSSKITVPLYRPFTCQHFQSGIIENYVNGVKKSQTDYGTYITGECENTATWTNGTVTKTITLKTGINYYKVNQ